MKPLVSIIIPTYRRPIQLQNCLEAINQIDYPKEKFEVIVVDDGSDAPPVKEVERFTESLQIKLVMQPNAGPSKARNVGARQANGKFLVFTDDDCLLAPDFLSILENRFSISPKSMIGGNTINAISENIYSTTAQMIVDFVYAACNRNPENAFFFASNNLALPTAEFWKINGFNPSYRTAEDRNLCARWRNAGGLMVYEPKAIVYHTSELSFYKFWKQYFNYGRGAYHFRLDKENSSAQKSQTNIKFHANLKNWLLYPFSRTHFGKASMIMCLLIVWEVANVSGFLWEVIASSFAPKKRVLNPTLHEISS